MVPASHRVRGRLYKQTQSGVPRREEACRREQTKPICPAVPGSVVRTNPIHAISRSGDQRSRRGQLCQTNPIRGRAGRDEAEGRGAIAPNEPNFGQPNGRNQQDAARQTKPICDRVARDEGRYRPPVRFRIARAWFSASRASRQRESQRSASRNCSMAWSTLPAFPKA